MINRLLSIFARKKILGEKCKNDEENSLKFNVLILYTFQFGTILDRNYPSKGFTNSWHNTQTQFICLIHHLNTPKQNSLGILHSHSVF